MSRWGPLQKPNLNLPWKRTTPPGVLQSSYTPGAQDGQHCHVIMDLVYITECQLATVEDLTARAAHGKFSKGELERHQRIAEFCIDACILHGVQEAHVVEAPRMAQICGWAD